MGLGAVVDDAAQISICYESDVAFTVDACGCKLDPTQMKISLVL